jgi:hypothetical protein
MGGAVAEAFDRIPDLIEQGEKFTIENVGPKTQHGNVRALSHDWLIWTYRE